MGVLKQFLSLVILDVQSDITGIIECSKAVLCMEMESNITVISLVVWDVLMLFYNIGGMQSTEAVLSLVYGK